MTVSYQYKVASSTSGGFTRLLFMWRGSLYKLIYRELLIFLIAFDILSILYRNLLTHEQKLVFETMVKYCDNFIKLIPLTFILGFYVAYVAARWWQQYEAIPWPDKCMHTIALYISGNDDRIRMVRRTMMRYLNLTLVLILRSISSAVKKRFPTLDHLTEVGFMTPVEKQMFLAIPNCDFNTYWVPCAWFVHVLKDIKAENPNIDPIGVKLIMEEFNTFRGKCGLLWSYDWISIPLVYTQVVTLATYSFFLVALVGRQYVEHNAKEMQMMIDIYLPVFTILQFFFFMGLLKVAEQMINPFGDDDEDFELNWLIDRHTKVSYLGVDTLMLHRPPLTKDKYFDNADLILPYTGASVAHKKKTYRGSFYNMQVPEDQQDMYLPEIIEEDSDEGSTPAPPKTRRPSIFASTFQRRSSEDQLKSSPPKMRRGSMFTNPFTRRTSTDHSPPVKARRNSLLTNPFNRRPSVDHQQNGDKNSGSGRFTSDVIGNGVNGQYKNTTPSTTVNGKSIDTDLDHISIISTRNSDVESSVRRPVAKHNSMMYTPGSRKPRWGSVKEKRRKSVPALVMRKDSTVLRQNASKWSLRRDSMVDTHWKGIRWTPLPRCERAVEALNVSTLEGARNDNQFTFVNRAFTNSPPETRNVRTIIREDSTTEENEQEVKDTSQSCDNASSSRDPSKEVNADVVFHLSSHDSLV